MTPHDRARQIDAEEFRQDSKRALDRALAYSKQKQEERRRQFLTFAFGKEAVTMALDKLHAPTDTDRTPVTFYTFGKKTFSAAQWAHRLGIDFSTLSRLAHEHGSMEAGIAFCLKNRRKRAGKPAERLECNGLKLSRNQWADRLGIPVRVFNRRLSKYGVDHAVAMGRQASPVERLANMNTEDVNAHSRRKWADLLGIAYSTFCGRIARHGLKGAIAMGGPNPRGSQPRPANDNAPGVVSDFVPVEGTGAGAALQDGQEYNFHSETENA